MRALGIPQAEKSEVHNSQKSILTFSQPEEVIFQLGQTPQCPTGALDPHTTGQGEGSGSLEVRSPALTAVQEPSRQPEWSSSFPLHAVQACG